jgi:hypothetical protein
MEHKAWGMEHKAWGMEHREIKLAADSSQQAANIHHNLPAAGCRLHAGAGAWGKRN